MASQTVTPLRAAVGLSVAARSPDGSTWTAQTIPAGTYYGLAWNGSMFAAAGYNGAAVSSSDGVTWTSRTIPAGNYVDVAWGGSRFVAVGYYMPSSSSTYVGACATSPDGLNWAACTLPAGQYNAVAWNGSLFVAVGYSVAATSPDGINWTSRALTGPYFSVIWNGSVFVAVGYNGLFATSPDGATWTARSTAITGNNYTGVAWNGTVSVAVGFTYDGTTYSGLATTSRDGITWTPRSIPSGRYQAVAWDGSRFIAVGTNVIATSADGITWASGTIPSGTYYAIAAGTLPVLSLDAITPTSGPTSGGTSVRLNGANFTPGVTVTFGGTLATNVQVANLTTLTATTPSRSTSGAVDVAVISADGQQTALLAGGFQYYAVSPAPPVIGSIEPTSGPIAGGTVVEITGSGFQANATVNFGDAPATGVTVASATSITAVTPRHAAGAVDVSVTNSGGDTASLPGGYRYEPMSLTSVSPVNGPESGGQMVTITGNHFQTGASVSFGGSAATQVVVSSSTTIVAKAPAHAPAVVDVVVTNPDSETAKLVGAYSYLSSTGCGAAASGAPPVWLLGLALAWLIRARCR